MIFFIILLISFLSSIIGAICGIGGGIIIKPVLDSFGILSVAAISFLSGCTVLSMSLYSVIKSIKSEKLNMSYIFPLALGGASGGILGKITFDQINSIFKESNTIGAVQAILLLVVTVLTLLYSINKNKIKTYTCNNNIVKYIIGLFLGIISSFLGIGGGPMNLIVFYFFFSMTTKDAVNGSLFVILFSQIANLLLTIYRGIPEVELIYLMGMILMGILGGFFGKKINKHLDDKKEDILFICLLVFIIFINCYNIYIYL